MSKMLALSIDLGNGFVKFTKAPIHWGKGNAVELQTMQFPSYAPPVRSSRTARTVDQMLHVDAVTVKVEGVEYRVGPDALLGSSSKASRLPTESFYRSAEYVALYRGALAYMDLPQHVDTIDMMGFGLPLETYEDVDVRNKVIATIQGKHTIPLLMRDGYREITVKKVNIMPQLVGSLIALSCEDGIMKAVSEKSNLVIDVGYGTLLWLVTEGMKPQLGRSGGNRGGVATILDACIGRMNPKLKSNPTILARLDDAIRKHTTVEISGENVDLAPYRNEVRHEVQRNLRELESSVGEVDSISNIFLVGGGRHIYLDAVKELCKGRKIHVTAGDPQISNLTGFQLNTEAQLGL